MNYRNITDPTKFAVPVGGGDKSKSGTATIAPSRREKNHVGKQHVTAPIEKGRLGGKKFG